MKSFFNLFTVTILIGYSSLSAQSVMDSEVKSEPEYSEFEIESIRVIALPTKENGNCWDSCDEKTKTEDQRVTKEMEKQAKTFVEVGTLKADEKFGARVPTPEEINAYYDIAKTFFSVVTSQTHLPEMTLRIRLPLPKEQKISYLKFQRDRFEVTFNYPQRITLPKKSENRILLVEVIDEDVLESDQMGHCRIVVGDSVYSNGGSIVVRFGRIHFFEIFLRKLDSTVDQVLPN
jgi:hypothetical protein